MRLLMILICLSGPMTSSGCSKDSPATPASTPAVPHDSPAVATGEVPPSTMEEVSDFDPKLTLGWPGTPITTCGRLGAGSADETTIYNADLAQTEPATNFSVRIYQSTAKALESFDPKETLSESALDDDDVALSRREIEHGPHKYPGIDVTAKSGDCFARRVLVVAGTRTYRVEVLSTRQERLNAEDVTRFFESFAVQD